MMRTVRYHEEVDVGEGGKVTLSADDPDRLRAMLYELRDNATAAIIRVEDDMATIGQEGE
jgi:hypothetical protein